MRIIKANIECILMDRIPDNCLYDCPFCCEKIVGDELVAYCPVIDELVYPYNDDIPECCPLVYDDSEEVEDKKSD